MSALTSPQGPLPARVYWFRRILVLTVVFLVVFGAGRLLAGGSDGDNEASEGAVTTVSAATEAESSDDPSGTPAPEGSPSADPSSTPAPGKKKVKQTPPPLPTPSGVCSNEEVVVTPVVPKERTTVKVPITLVLSTTTTEACTWQVSPRSLTVKIDSGPRESPDEIWHSRHCPAVIPTRDVTLYREHETKVEMVWNGRRSDDECSNLTDWARSGWYHVNAAAYAGEPVSVQFELTRPSPVTVTRTVDPKPSKKSNQKKSKKQQQKNRKPQRTPKPSGAVEPDL